ncbi:unnamed protein product [Ceutorhynchus assimilis]|uniref:poly(ADP-ribose) glycohydrolase n=1 Tax=Ceutorhynchus assimilis TaxID=467358 RepID=A0A9N9QRH1_9CUCU|nr:unnamed protein product [Ceutorhynchus assimilis]
MALVMLPSDLPWWDAVKKQLKKIASTKNTLEIIQGMQKIYEMCNVSLDPEDDTVDPEQFVGLLNFLDNEMTFEERSNFLNKTLPNIIKRALMVKELRPRRGLHFSLQQQTSVTEIDYNLAASLLANAFFSTFPKRTDKSHPTLQNFNFAAFFKHFSSNSQKAKFRSILQYFDWLDLDEEHSKGNLRVLRQVMRSKEWLTIDDWLECSLDLCPLQIKHDGRLEHSDQENLQICFSSAKIGGNVLETGYTQESINLTTIPELLTLLLFVEALEDNEVVTVEKARHVARIADPKHKATFEKLDDARLVNICCLDADDYTKLPIGQYEEDNILRELNKCLLAFQQKKIDQDQNTSNSNSSTSYTYTQRHRRLSPIGESIGSNQSDGTNQNVPLINQQSCSTTRTDSLISENSGNNNTLQVRLQMPQKKGTTENLVNNRRGRFIVLGSSGECLPVSRYPRTQKSASSSEDDFHSAKSSLEDDSEDDNYHKRYSIDLETPERRRTFAQRLREALKKEETSSDVVGASDSEESSYAVGISVAGSGLTDCDIKVKRGGSTGFALKEDSLDEEFLQNSLTKERQWIDKFKTKQTSLTRKESHKSSEYSFSTEYSSELEEVYEQFSHWLENPILETEKGDKKELEARDLAVVRFAGSLLKRTLSESFAGVPMTESCDSTQNDVTNFSTKKNKIVLNAKSLSLELARQKHRLAAQLISAISPNTSNGIRPIATGNWGCGASRKGDVQLKVVVQWMAASVAGAPRLVYYTHKHQQLAKLDTVCRILIDRKWTVKDLARATLRYSSQVLRGREVSGTLFEELIGNFVDK